MAASESLFRLLCELSDGRFHSGEQLARKLGLSRAGIWKQVRRLEQEFELPIDAVRGRGYRLDAPLELLDAEAIKGHISLAAQDSLQSLKILTSVASTNSVAAINAPQQSRCASVWLAEHQTDGRGRRGRDWVGAFGRSIFLSLAWRFDIPMASLSALSLAAGVAIAEALSELGVSGHSLKWPNDLLVDGRKLAGVLVEVSGEAQGPATAVIGVGINLRMPQSLARQIDQPWTDLASLSDPLPPRNALAGKVIEHLIQACHVYAQHGLNPYLTRWRAFDNLFGQRVRLHSKDRFAEGVYAGISATGALLLDTAQGRSEHLAGEVSLRGEAPR